MLAVVKEPRSGLIVELMGFPLPRRSYEDEAMTFRAPSSAVLLCVLCAAGSVAAAREATRPGKHPISPAIVKSGSTSATSTSPSHTTAASGTSILPGSGSKEPISINAETLDFLNKENRLIYSGNVVAIQGDSTLKASKLNIDLDRDAPTGPTPGHADATPAGGTSSVRHMEADGPVTLISKDQIGTGDHATYDKAENRVYLKGHVTLTQGPNVTQGDNLIYETPSGHARVTGNVRSLIVPGNGTQGGGALSQADGGAIR